MNLGVDDLKAIAAAWRTARRIYPVYVGIAERFGLAAPSCKELESPVNRADFEAVAALRRWLCRMDELIQVHQLRLFLQTGPHSTESNLRALIEHLLADRSPRTPATRDKVDFLLVQYFAQCAPSAMLHGEPSLADVGRVLEPLVGEAVTEVPGWLEPLDHALRRLIRCTRMHELLQAGVLAQGRDMKGSAEEGYFSPAALVAFARYNYLVRQTFFRLLRADLEVIRRGARELLKHGVATINCERAQFSENEPLARILELCQGWKKPFQAEYSAGNPFLQLVELRAAVEEALVQYGLGASSLSAAPAVSTVRSLPEPVSPAPATATMPPPQPPAACAPAAVTPRSSAPAATAPALQAAASHLPVFTVEVAPASTAQPQSAPAAPGPGLAEEIRIVVVQLAKYLQADLARSRTAGATIVLGSARLALSSWEVTAFVEGMGDFTPVIQHGVATRVLLFQVLQQVRQGAPPQRFKKLITVAEDEARRLEASLADAREAGDIEATVTLSATQQRLNALLQEARDALNQG